LAIANEIEGAYCWRDAGVFYGITGMDTSVFNVAILEDRQPLTAGRLERIGVQMMNIPLPYSIQFCHHLRQPQSDLAILERGHYLNFHRSAALAWWGAARYSYTRDQGAQSGNGGKHRGLHPRGDYRL